MKKLIVANWKENPTTQQEAKELFELVKKEVKGIKHAEVVICPPFVYLPLFANLTLGAQNVSYQEKGAFTGEVSALMLKDLKVKYVIVGHSEARKYLNETDEIVNKKVKEVLAVKLKPILCIGENTGENKRQVLEKQLADGLREIINHKSEILNVVIAYEPIWAIGTGNNCSIEETKKSVLLIREIIAKLYNKSVSKNMIVLYGGSVNPKNSGLYIKDAGISGLLVGGASLNTQEFIEIVKSAR